MTTVENPTREIVNLQWCVTASHYATGTHGGPSSPTHKSHSWETYPVTPGARLTYDETLPDGPLISALASAAGLIEVQGV